MDDCSEQIELNGADLSGENLQLPPHTRSPVELVPRAQEEINPYRTLVAAHEHILVNRFDAPNEVDLARVHDFLQNFQATICELGSGSGQHLIHTARHAPQDAHIGFEIRYKRAYRTVEKAQAQGVQNLAMIRGDAKYLAHYFRPSSLRGVYILFPDPWDKKRWLKNRLVGPSLLDTLSGLLSDDGFFAFRTDHLSYFDSVVALLATHPDFKLVRQSRNIPVPDIEGRAVSEFELLFRSKNTPISELLALRLPR